MERPLKDLLFDYCENKEFSIERSGLDNIDYVLSNDNEGIAVMVKDWKRAMGVDVVIQADRLKKYSKSISKVLIITNLCSAPAMALANRISILILDRERLLEKIQ